jgi:ABC-2 type transport system permease protein
MSAGRPTRHDPAFPNVMIIARREYGELVRGRLFKVSTLILVTLVLFVAMLPIAVRLFQREQNTVVGVVASDPELSERSMTVLRGLLSDSGERTYRLIPLSDAEAAVEAVGDRELDAAIVAIRRPSGGLGFGFHLGETMGQQEIQQLSYAVLGVALLDYSAQNAVTGFELPEVEIFRALGGNRGGGGAFDPAVFASRLIVGAVFGFLIFLSIVIYGMWVAQGVVAEKMSRVMELLISAASARQLVVGKAIGIGLAGATQTLLVLIPALAALAIEDVLARQILGQSVGIASSLSAISPGLLLAFATYYLLGFALYALVYAAGPRISRSSRCRSASSRSSATARESWP